MDSLLGVKQRRTNNFPGLSQIYGCKDRLKHMQEMTTPDEGGIPFFSSPIASGGMLLKSIILNLAQDMLSPWFLEVNYARFRASRARNLIYSGIYWHAVLVLRSQRWPTPEFFL